MRIVFFCFTYFLTFFVTILEGSGGKKPKCITCGTIAEHDVSLNLKYCPHCVKNHQGSWRYFINFTKNKLNHVNESYISQYTCLDFMNRITPRLLLQNYEENVFVEFVNALWGKLNNKEVFFKNPDLQALFLALFEEIQEDEETSESKTDLNNLLRFYCELKWICLALYYECRTTENYRQYIHNIFEEIDENILFIQYYIENPT